MKILEFRAENMMRLSVVSITPEGHLIEITGANAQGKTSVLDSIWIALAGKDAAPDKPIRKGATTARTELKIGPLKDGGGFLTVERTFTARDDGGFNNYLKVKDVNGYEHKSPQKMLDALMGAIGFDPASFMRMDAKQQFAMLRGLVKLDADIDALDRKRATIYSERTITNRELENAKARALTISVPNDLPDDEPDIAEITDRLTLAAQRTAEIERHRANLIALGNATNAAADRVAAAREALARAELDLGVAVQQADTASSVVEPAPIDAAAVRVELDNANAVAEGFRKQKAKIEADAAVTTLERQAVAATTTIQEIDDAKKKAISEAKMPVEGLGFEDDTVTFQGLPLAQASAAQQLRVSAAIGAALNPELRVMLCRDGSLLDKAALKALSEFATETDFQIFLERVDESGEIGIVIEDGHVKGQEALVEEQAKKDAGGAAAPEPDKAEPTGERADRAQAFLDGEIARLPSVSDEATLDLMNAGVKTKLKAFPSKVAAWVPLYLERLTAVKKLKK